MKKPPLGVKPRWLHEEHRMLELSNAMVRFEQAGYEVPSEWKEELTELQTRFFS